MLLPKETEYKAAASGENARVVPWAEQDDQRGGWGYCAALLDWLMGNYNGATRWDFCAMKLKVWPVKRLKCVSQT